MSDSDQVDACGCGENCPCQMSEEDQAFLALSTQERDLALYRRLAAVDTEIVPTPE